MKAKYSALMLAIALCLTAAHRTEAGASANVIVDGKLLSLDKQPEIVNGRVMAPVRAIAENIGAAVGWDAGSNQISVFSHERYAVMRAGDPNMVYGSYKPDASGGFAYGTQLVYVMDVPPLVSGGRALAPLRGLAEALGAEVGWDPATATVYVNSAAAAPQAQPASPTPTAAPSYGSSHFKEISADQAQRWYNAGAPFVMFYYSHLSESGMAVLNWARQSAARQNLMLYGVDVDSANFNNTGGGLTFIWDYLDKSRDGAKASLLFVGKSKSVTPLIQPRDARSIDFCMAAFRYGAVMGQTSAGGDLPEKVPDRPAVNIAPYWREITRDAAIAKQKNNEKFIYICYNSHNADSNSIMPMVWLAVEQAQTTVYATDFANIKGDLDWFGKDALNGKQVYAYPTIFFVFGRDGIPFGSVQPKNALEIMNAFYNFSK